MARLFELCVKETNSASSTRNGHAIIYLHQKNLMNLILLLFIFVLAAFLGFELIAKVPSQLHTPLMSGSNAISGITIVGAILATMISGDSNIAQILGFIALVFASINVVGGYMVTDRMLGMFQGKKKPKGEQN